jgi:tetratricopeptide (TPR) repeat protein
MGMAGLGSMSRSRQLGLAALLLLGGMGWGATARAEENVAAAANAFSRAQRAALAGDYAQAAELFELADSLAPTPEALRSAIGARREQGQLASAAAHAEELLRRYPDDPQSRTLAEETLGEAKRRFGRHEVSCSPDPCLLTVDDAAAGSDARKRHVIYLSPGAHRIAAVFGGRRTDPQSVDSAVGSESRLEFVPPKPKAVAAPEPAKSGDAPERDRGAGGGLSPWFFGVAAGVTVVLAGVSTWSGLDTLEKRDEYDKNRTQAGYNEGRDLERRTNLLLGATAVAGLATVTFAIFTDWSGSGSDRSARLGVGPAAADGSPGFLLEGSF